MTTFLALTMGKSGLMLTLAMVAVVYLVAQNVTGDTMTFLEAKAAKLGEAQDIITAAGNNMSAEDLERVKGLKAEADGLQADHDRAEEAAEIGRGIGADLKLMNQPPTRKTATSDVIIVGAEGFEADPKFGYNSHADFLADVVDSCKKGSSQTPNMKAIVAAAGGDEAGTFRDEDGGVLMPSAFLPTVKVTNIDADPVAAMTTRVPMAVPTVSFAARVDKDHTDSVSGGLKVFRRAEAGSVDPTKMNLEGIRLTANALMGASYATRELIERSPISFATLIAQGFAQEFRARLMRERLTGAGNGEYLGIHNSDALITVDKEVGQDADTIVYENVVNMMTRCWGYGNAVWMISQEALAQLFYLQDPAGHYIFHGGYHTSAAGSAPMTLLGRPIIVTEFCERLGDLGDIVLANWGEYVEGTYSPVRSESSIHVRFSTHETALKFWTENDGTTWWSAPLQPKKGAPTLSPFVVLEARAA